MNSVAIFSTICALGLFMIIGVCGSFSYRDNKEYRYVLNCGFLIMIFISTVGLLICALAFPLSYSIVDTCGVLDDVLSSSAHLQNYSKLTNINVLDECIYGN